MGIALIVLAQLFSLQLYIHAAVSVQMARPHVFMFIILLKKQYHII